MPRVLVLTDRAQLPLGRSLQATLAACADGGLTHVVLRELDLSDDQRGALAERLAARGLTVIAARRPVAGATAVHLAADQAPPADGTPWGRSCHSADEVRAAAADEAAWVTLSPFAPTASKPGYGPPVPAHAFADHTVPVYALGGITTPAEAERAVAAGAHGVAVMGALMRAEDPSALARLLLGAVA